MGISCTSAWNDDMFKDNSITPTSGLWLNLCTNSTEVALTTGFGRRAPGTCSSVNRTFLKGTKVFTRARNGELFQMVSRRESGQYDEPRDEAILDAIAEDPTTSTRRLGLQLGVPHSSVHVLRRHDLHPYHLTKVQELLARDAPLRLRFCQWYRDEFPYRGDNVLWTDEATFTRSGYFNLHNSHVWDEENPHASVVSHHQYEFRANVWAGMTRNQLFGPEVLPNWINSAEFQRFLDNEIFDYLEDMPLEQRRGLWFQMDGCPAYRGCTVTEWMNSNFENRSKNVVYFKGREVDVTKFQPFHPGGDLLSSYWGEDVTRALKQYHHGRSTYDIIKSCGEDGDHDGFVDWSQPVFKQIGQLGKVYGSWVQAPTVRPMRIFASDWMEAQTKTKVHELVIYWFPISIWLFSLSWEWRESDGFGWRRLARFVTIPMVFNNLCIYITVLGAANLAARFWNNAIQHMLLLSLGVMKWTLFEYCVHRWIFHFTPPETSPLMITIHFMMHGIHHKIPFDPDRLLFPLAPGTVIGVGIYSFYTLYMPTWMCLAVMSGTIQGYVAYDVIHHFLHHGSPRPGSYLYFMKRYHNQHHFGDSTKGFGITSHLWDEAFASTVQIKKLSFDLHWNENWETKKF